MSREDAEREREREGGIITGDKKTSRVDKCEPNLRKHTELRGGGALSAQDLSAT